MQNLMAKILSFLLFLSSVGLFAKAETAFAQTPEFSLIKSIPVKGVLLSSDHLGNAYVVNEKQELLKINPAGEIEYINNIASLGRIASISTINPLKLLIFYPEYSTVVTLDNTLSITSRINLLQMESNIISAAAIALDNNIWVYDEVMFKLRKLNENLKPIVESEVLYALLGKAVRGNFIIEKDRNVFMNDPQLGILIFDNYGTYSKTIPIPGLKNFQLVQDQLVYFKDGKLFSYHLLSFEEKQYSIPGDDAVYAHIESDRLFVLRKDRLDVYSY